MLEVKNLNISFLSGQVQDQVVKDVNFSVRRQEVVGIVGESGSGKSLTALAIAGLLPTDAQCTGEILFRGHRLRPGREKDWQGVRGKEMGIVFQDPTSSLNPLLPVGKQVSETLRRHKGLSENSADAITIDLFNDLGICPAAVRVRQYPHQLSGGQQQRVMMAAGICCEPYLLIADEPTTALDVTVQAQILTLLRRVVKENKTSLLLISHDLGVIAQLADRVLVMCAGVVVEEAPVHDLFRRPCHPYTQSLMSSVPRLDRPLFIRKLPDKIELSEHACCFADRCHTRRESCLTRTPKRRRLSPSRTVNCHQPEEEI